MSVIPVAFHTMSGFTGSRNLAFVVSQRVRAA